MATFLHSSDRADLSALLGNRRWIRSAYPFPYVCATEVFVPEFYQLVENAYQAILGRGLSESSTSKGFSRTFAAYDAYGADLPTDLENPLSVFVSRSWHDMIARIFNINVTGDMNAALHHHRAGSGNGSIHNDLNPGWFIGAATAERVNIADSALCSYKYGSPARGSGGARETIRAIAMIFYLANRGWNRGDGGETGLYEVRSDSVDHPAIAIPPFNNSLLAFECSPFSFHSFIRNKYPRNCVVLWWHRTRGDATSRWGEHKIVGWTPRR